MRYFLSLLILFAFCSLAFTIPNALAHELETDGSIGAVMHVNPNDDPIAGQQSGFFFEFKDTKNKFDPKQCECTFSVVQDGHELYTQPLFQTNATANLSNPSVMYTFPEKGVYVIKLSGNPKTDKYFDPFSLEYDIRVDQTTQNTQTTENTNWLAQHMSVIIGGVLGLSALLFFVIKLSKNEKKH
jgi:hypothetical protein